jgi:hypothetical protein
VSVRAAAAIGDALRDIICVTVLSTTEKVFIIIESEQVPSLNGTVLVSMNFDEWRVDLRQLPARR